MPLQSSLINDYLLNDATFCVLLYGNLGTGKTSLSASAQQHEDLRDLIYIDADPGLSSVAQKEGIDTVYRISFTEVKDLMSLVPHLKSKHPTVKTVVFDSISATSSRRMTELSDTRPADVVDFRDYRTVTGNIEKIVNTLRGAGYNIIMTAGVKDETQVIENKTFLVKRRPDLPPELSRRIGHFVNHLWHVYISPDGSYNLLFQPMFPPGGGEIVAKTQNDDFAKKMQKIQRPNLPGVIQIGKVGDDPDKYKNMKDFYTLYLEAIKGE